MAAQPGGHGDTRRENREDFTKIDFYQRLICFQVLHGQVHLPPLSSQTDQ